MTFNEVKNCEIIFGNTTKEMFPPKYQIWIKNRDANKIDIVNIGNSSTIREMKNLVHGDSERIYLSYRIDDIDMYRVKDKFIISNSPIETLYTDYYLTEEQFLAIILDLETDNITT